MKNTQVARLLAYVTGMVNQQLLLQNEYLVAENRILRAHLPIRLRLTDPQRSTLAEIGKRLGRQTLRDVTSLAKPETILAWYQKLIARKFDGSKHRRYPGRPAVGPELTQMVVRMARENSGWGYDRIAGALKNLGHCLSDQSVGNILRRFWYRSSAEAPSANDLGRVHSISYGGSGKYRFLYRGSAHLARPDHLLCPVLSAPGDTACHASGNHQTSLRAMDGPDGSQCSG